MQKLSQYLKPIYSEKAEYILAEIGSYAEKLTDKKLAGETTKTPYWYKQVVLYVAYPDSVQYDENCPPFNNLILHLPHLCQLGCNCLHILPFLRSPMVDKGFDISDYYEIRSELGTLDDLRKLKQEADKIGIRLIMDLVLNHVSEQHEWFRKAQQGDKKYREYFLYEKKQPHFIRKFRYASAIWAEYEVNGKRIAIDIAFPEMTGKIPHWRQGGDGYWYYHTYYPQQLDLNWFNPDVFIEIAKVMLYWAYFGFHFRIDAIPFVGKTAYKKAKKENKGNGRIIAALKYLAELINPEIVFIAETYEALPIVIKRFGTKKRIQTNLSYNFHLCTGTWVSLIKKDTSYIWEKLTEEWNIPEHGEWINFLRNHDELSLAHLADELREEVRHTILSCGKDFREGCGVSGRTFSFLRKNKQRFMMAYFLVASFPGSLLIPYGDELGYTNIPLAKLAEKEVKDTRNINRGLIRWHEVQNERQRVLMAWMSTLLARRKQFEYYLKDFPRRVTAPRHIYAARHKNAQGSELFTYANLESNCTSLELPTGRWRVVFNANDASVLKDSLQLGPYGGAWLIRSMDE